MAKGKLSELEKSIKGRVRVYKPKVYSRWSIEEIQKLEAMMKEDMDNHIAPVRWSHYSRQLPNRSRKQVMYFMSQYELRNVPYITLTYVDVILMAHAIQHHGFGEWNKIVTYACIKISLYRCRNIWTRVFDFLYEKGRVNSKGEVCFYVLTAFIHDQELMDSIMGIVNTSKIRIK